MATPMPSEHKPTVVPRGEAPGERRTGEYVATGSVIEAIGGVGAVVLAILALAGVLPMELAAVAAIAAGAAFVIRGTSVAARYHALSRALASTRFQSAELGGGVSVDLVGGIAGIALGILALLGVVPLTLLAAAAIIFGATLLIGSGLTERLNEIALRHAGADGATHELMRESLRAAAGAQILVGIGAIALGILALVGVAPLSLVLIAFIAVGGSQLITGSALGARMGTIMH